MRACMTKGQATYQVTLVRFDSPPNQKDVATLGLDLPSPRVWKHCLKSFCLSCGTWEGALLVRKMSTHQKALGRSDDLGLSSICFFPQIELEVQRGGGPQKEIPIVCWVSMFICGVILRLGVGKLNRAAADRACNSIGWLDGCACWARTLLYRTHQLVG